MQTLTDQLSKYAAFHRDRRNIVTHFIGIPLIVLAVAALLSRPAWALADTSLVLTPAGSATLRPPARSSECR